MAIHIPTFKLSKKALWQISSICTRYGLIRVTVVNSLLIAPLANQLSAPLRSILTVNLEPIIDPLIHFDIPVKEFKDAIKNINKYKTDYFELQDRSLENIMGKKDANKQLMFELVSKIDG